MPELGSLSTEQLQAYLLNAIRYLDERPDDAARLIPEILDQMAGRRAEAPATENILTTLGYNVRWRDWHAKERHRLLDWLLDAPLPAPIEAAMGPAGSRQRQSFVAGTIERWTRMYGRRENMEQALARWRADLAFIRSRATTR